MKIFHYKLYFAFVIIYSDVRKRKYLRLASKRMRGLEALNTRGVRIAPYKFISSCDKNFFVFEIFLHTLHIPIRFRSG